MSHYQLTQVYLQALFGNLLERVRGDDREIGRASCRERVL